VLSPERFCEALGDCFELVTGSGDRAPWPVVCMVVGVTLGWRAPAKQSRSFSSCSGLAFCTRPGWGHGFPILRAILLRTHRGVQLRVIWENSVSGNSSSNSFAARAGFGYGASNGSYESAAQPSLGSGGWRFVRGGGGSCVDNPVIGVTSGAVNRGAHDPLPARRRPLPHVRA
jgi:hypothetical protein